MLSFTPAMRRGCVLPVKPNLRQVFAESAELLAAIHAECFPRYWNSSEFTDFFSVPGTQAVLAEVAGGKPAGMLVYRLQFEQADILTLAVLPAFRGQGVATQLLAHGLEAVQRYGAQKMFLEVEDGNAAALALYEKAGFSHLSRRKLYYRQKDGSFTDALVMTKKLA